MTQRTLWGRLNSINVQKVLWLCEDLGLNFDRVDAGLQFGVNQTLDYLAMNPNGLVPTLKENDFVLWESHSILRYLAKTHDPSGTLYPQALKDCALVDQWLDWSTTTAWPPMRILFWGWIRTSENERNQSDLEKNRLIMQKMLTILDDQLRQHAWVAGEHFTVADIPLALIVHRWFLLPIEREDLAHVERWFSQMSTRPGFIRYGSSPLS
jgi:glutathione S-transferase